MATKGLLLARLSPRDGDSEADLAKMVRELHTFAAAEGIPIVDVIAERNVSAWAGATGEKTRKGRWPEVVEGLRTGRWDALVVRGLNRTARDAMETMALLRLYARGGWTFHAMNGDDLDDAKGTALKGLLNQWESDEKSFTIKLKWADKAAGDPTNGRLGEYHPGRWRPFGYSYTPGSRMLVPIGEEAEIVREVAHRLIAGESAHMIALDLEAREIPTVSGAQWQRNMVLRLVKPCVAGLTTNNGETAPGNWPAILDMDLYHVVRSVIDEDKDTKPHGHNARRHLLAGILVCGRCGVPMQCNGRVYQCTTKATKNGQRGCGRVAIVKTKVEPWVRDLVRAFLATSDAIVEQDADALGWGEAVKAAEAEVKAIQDAYESREISATDWIRGLKVARKKLANISDGRTEALRALGHQPEAWTPEHWEQMNLSQQQLSIRKVVEVVIVKPCGRAGKHPGMEGRIEVVWREQPTVPTPPASPAKA